MNQRQRIHVGHVAQRALHAIRNLNALLPYADDQLERELVVGLRVAAQRLPQLLDNIQEDDHA